MSHSSNKLSPEKSGWGWKLLIVAIILSCIFMGFFWLAITNDPEYMPSHKQQYTQQSFKNAPVMKQTEQAHQEQASSEAHVSHHP